jgi:hypothetical protein
MIVPQHLRLALYCAHVGYIFTLEGRAWASGLKEEMDLDMESVQELVDLGVLAINDRPQTGGECKGSYRVYSTGDRYAGSLSPLAVTFKETFADGILPQHPALWEMGDEDTAKYTVYEKCEAGVEGSFESDGDFLRAVDTMEPVIRSAYGEKFFYTKPHPTDRGGFIEKYRTGVVGPICHMDGFMLAALRCVIEHDVYSAGHVFMNRLDGGTRYPGALGSSGLYAMIRFGLVTAKDTVVDGWTAEHYEATDLGRLCYERALPNLSTYKYTDEWNRLAIVMGWNQ